MMQLHLVAVLIFGLAVAAEKVTITRVYSDLENEELGTRNKREIQLFPMKLSYRLVRDTGEIVMLKLTKVDSLKTTIINGGKSTAFSGNEPNVATYIDGGRHGVFLIRLNHFALELLGQFQMGQQYLTLNADPSFRDTYYLTDVNTAVDFTGDGIEVPGYPVVYPSVIEPRAMINYIVEIAFLADNAIYQKFLAKNNNDQIAAELEMSVYYAFVAEQLKVRFVADPSASIVLVISGLVIYTDPVDIGFVENNVYGVNHINSTVVIDLFKDYIVNKPAGINIPSSDHYMLFSGYDLVNPAGNKDSVGAAYIGLVCDRKYAVSLVEDTITQITSVSAAHQLAHNLGVKHDGDVSCDDNDQYIMATSFGAIADSTQAEHRWKFSSCFLQQVLPTLKRKSCLRDNRYGSGEFTTSPKLGLIYTKTEQCQFAINQQATHGVDNVGEECYKMKCVSNGVTTDVLPLDYSVCGINMWCVRGRCVNVDAYPVNSAPVITNLPEEITVTAGTQGAFFTVAASDTDGDAITFTHVWIYPSNSRYYFLFDDQSGVVSVNTGVKLMYSTLRNVVFTLLVTATDDKDASLSQTLTIRVIPVPNRPPTVDNLDDTISVQAGSQGVVFTVQGSDLDNDQITFIYNWISPADAGDFFTGSATTGAISVRNGQVLPPNQVFIAEIHATDGQDVSGVKTLTINTTPVPNRPPTVDNLDDTISVQEGSQGVVFTVIGSDLDNDQIAFIYNWISPADADDIFTVSAATGAISVKNGMILPPNQVFVVQVRATDGQNVSGFKTLAIYTTPTSNTAPQFTNLPATKLIAENPSGVIYTVSATDNENHPVQYTGTWNPFWATRFFNFDGTTGEVSAIPNTGLTYQMFKNVTFTLSVVASDNQGGSSAPADLTIRMSEPNLSNSAPVLSSTAYFAYPQSTQTGTNVFKPLTNDVTDQDVGDTTTFSIQNSTYSNYFNINSVTGEITFSQNYPSTLPQYVALTVEVRDRLGALDSAFMIVAIPETSTPLNLPNLPVEISVPEGTTPQTVIYTVNPPLVNNVPVSVTYSLSQSPATSPGPIFFIHPTSGQVSYVGSSVLDYESLPAKNFTLDVTANDNNGASTSEHLSVIVTNVNEPPQFTQNMYNISVNEGMFGHTVINSLVSSVSDPDVNDVVSFQILPGPNSQYFTIDPTTGRISYAVNYIGPGFPSTVTLTVLARDSGGLVTTSAFIIDVQRTQNQVPYFSNLPDTMFLPSSQASGVAFFVASGRDDDANSVLTYSIDNPSSSFPQVMLTINPSNGQVSLINGVSLAFIPQQTFDLMISVSDGTATTTKALTISIASMQNQPPVFNPDSHFVTVVEGQAGKVVMNNLSGSVTDPNSGDSLTYSINPSSQYFHIDPVTGVITFSVDYFLNSRPSYVAVSVTVTDSGGLTDSATVNVLINTSTSPLQFHKESYFAIISRLALPGSRIVNVTATGESGANLEYSLIDDMGIFAINQNTGEVTIRQGVDLATYMPNSTITLQVVVSDGLESKETILTVVFF